MYPQKLKDIYCFLHHNDFTDFLSEIVFKISIKHFLS